jgi:hypothetical protein
MFYILAVNEKTLFTKLDNIYPECNQLINGYDSLQPLQCFKQDFCPRNFNCAEKMARRVGSVFTAFPKAQLLVLYFKPVQEPNQMYGGVFWENMDIPPRVIKMHTYAWNKFKEIGVVYEWDLPGILLT